MKRHLLGVGFAFASACGQTDGASNTAASIVEDVSARVDYSLPGDGCDWNLVIDDVSYRPDDASLPDVKAFDDGCREVHVDYRLTGRNVSLVCGWNTHRDVAEITVLSISPACVPSGPPVALSGVPR